MSKTNTAVVLGSSVVVGALALLGNYVTAFPIWDFIAKKLR